MFRNTLLIISGLFLLNQASLSQNTLYDRQMKVGFEERQGQYADLTTKLVNESGDTVLLKDVITKPTLLQLAYFQCPGTCSPLMWGISKSIDAVDLQLGRDYQFLTISFDPSEGIDLGKAKKASYLATMKKKDDATRNWLFFVSDSVDIAKLTKSVGFHYERFNNQYIHPTGLIALASDGKIIRYLNGIDFLPFDIKITMIEAAKGKIGPPINRLLAICYSYDQKGNQFVFNVIKVAGILILFFLVVILAFVVFYKKKSKQKMG